MDRALFSSRVCRFIETTQPKWWGQMRKLHADALEEQLLNALVKELQTKGILHILHNGFKFYGKTFRVANFKSAHELSEWRTFRLDVSQSSDA